MQSLDGILESFELGAMDAPDRNDRQSVTVWLPRGAKARYDRLQEISGRRFSKKVREIIMAAIEKAEAKAS